MFWMLACVLGIGLTIFLVVVLRRQERGLTSTRTARFLLALRLTVLVLLLLMMLQPVYSWSLERDRSGRIVVALDLSESMQVADQHATAVEKLRWARAIETVGNTAIDEQLDRWEQQLKEPSVDRADEFPEEQPGGQPAVSDALQSVMDSMDRLSRDEMARRLLTQTRQPLLERLERLAAVDLLVFAGRTQTQDPQTLEDAVREVPDGLLPDVSDLAEGLDGAISQDPESALLGVVLLTDGRDTGDADPLAAATRLAAQQTPVFPVLMGSSYRPRDLAVLSVNHPTTVFTDDHPVVSAVISAVGFAGRQLTVHLEDDQGELQSQTIDVDSETVEVEFQLAASEVGRRGYRLWVDRDPDEARDDNNDRAFAISVVDDTIQVVLLDGVARWEFRFVDNALTRDARIQVSKVVFDQPFLGLLPDTFFPRKVPFDPQERDEAIRLLSDADLIVVGDVSPESIRPEHWDLLEHYVAEAGGTLVLQSGKNEFPARHSADALKRLMPVTDLRTLETRNPASATAPTDRGVRLKITDDGGVVPFLKLAAERHRNELIWSSFPGHLWMQVGSAKPGALVLAAAQAVRGEIQLDAERRYGAIVHQHYGFGQVVWMGVDSTWRWRHRVGDQYHHRFWGQLARWAADNKVAAGNDFVRFGPQLTDSVQGEDVVVLARWLPSFLTEHPQLKAEVELSLVDADGREQVFSTLPMEADRQRANIMQARAIGLPVGRYRTRLVCDDLADAAPVECDLYVHAKQTAELADLSANPQLLQEIADRTGGQLLYPHQLADFPELLQKRLQLSEVSNEVELWDHWGLLVLFCGLLSTEWIVRKLNGLP